MRIATPEMLAALPAEERARSVVLVQDAFTSWYEPRVVLAVLDLMRAIGFRPFVAPFRPNGKPLHVHGFLGAFTRAASRNASMLRDLAATGVELVGVDASMTLTYRSEYGMLPEADRPPPVLLLQEWLARRCDAIPKKLERPRRIPAAAALFRAFARFVEPPGLASGIRGSGRQLAHPAFGMLRNGRDLWP